MVTVVCVKAGSLYGADYVNRLYAGIVRNLRAGFPGKFVCFTDDPTGLDPAIEPRDLPPDIDGWWNKLALFRNGQFEKGERIVYFDLDTLIVGPLDEIMTYDGQFAILRDFYRPNGWQSSVMAWTPSVELADLWVKWDGAGRPNIEGGDQAWIEQNLYESIKVDLWQDKFPGAFVSFKEHCKPYPPEPARVVCFHGEPKPHDCGREWVAKMWHEDATAGFHLALERNTHLDTIRAQSKASDARGRTRLKSQPAHDGHVVIVGGGPSLNGQIEEIRWRQSIGQKIWALNGTHDWLIWQGIIPDALVLLDARRDNIGFVQRPRPEVCYYLASQCHPEIYDALAPYRVVRFDIDQMGDCGTTVGTHAMCVAFVEGYRQIHLVGFDSSYSDGEGHAYRQDLNARESIIDVQAGDKTFRAAPWMAQQVKDFISLAPDLIQCGCTITVHGTGLLPHVAKLMEASTINRVDIRAAEILTRLNGAKTLRGAEIGVFAGDLSSRLLARDGLSLLMVDSWEGDGKAYEGDTKDWHCDLSQAQQDAYAAKAAAVVKFAGQRAKIVRARSHEAADCVTDRSLDFVFIDADHSYEGCKRDIEAWWPKVRPGGLVSGHDYENDECPDFEVKRAVDEFAGTIGQPVQRGEDFTWFLTRT